MNQGRVEQVGSPIEVYHRPASTFVAGFIGAPGMNMLEAFVDEDGFLVLGDGQRLSPEQRRHTDLVPGRRVILGVRAETLRLAREPGANVLTGQFDFTEELGAARHVHCEIAGGALIVHTERPVGFAPRSRLLVAVEPRQIQLFDAQTRLRLAASGAGGSLDDEMTAEPRERLASFA
jgi:sn-glycerol 3-phosphate transport system ATP-binding protein